jgi:hypothetical protein
MFDTREEECVNYNDIGTLCGCYTNKLHPDACGHLCWNDDETMLSNFTGEVWGMTCSEWNILSSYLPIWYNKNCGVEFLVGLVDGCVVVAGYVDMGGLWEFCDGGAGSKVLCVRCVL